MKQSGTQQSDPTKDTNLSKSPDPAIAIHAHNNTNTNRNTFFCHFTIVLCLPERVNNPFSIIRIAGNNCNGIDKQIASAYNPCTVFTVAVAGMFNKITVCTSLPKAKYEMNPTDKKIPVMNIMVPDNTLGNFSGSAMDSVIGITGNHDSSCVSVYYLIFIYITYRDQHLHM